MKKDRRSNPNKKISDDKKQTYRTNLGEKKFEYETFIPFSVIRP